MLWQVQVQGAFAWTGRWSRVRCGLGIAAIVIMYCLRNQASRHLMIQSIGTRQPAAAELPQGMAWAMEVPPPAGARGFRRARGPLRPQPFGHTRRKSGPVPADFSGSLCIYSQVQ